MTLAGRSRLHPATACILASVFCYPEYALPFCDSFCGGPLHALRETEIAVPVGGDQGIPLEVRWRKHFAVPGSTTISVSTMPHSTCCTGAPLRTSEYGAVHSVFRLCRMRCHVLHSHVFHTSVLVVAVFLSLTALSRLTREFASTRRELGCTLESYLLNTHGFQIAANISFETDLQHYADSLQLSKTRKRPMPLHMT